MLKVLTHDDTTTTPYIATKDWNLSNVSNTDLVLAESGNPVGVENVDFGFLSTTPNYNCNVAKEDQSDDLASYREGLKITGLFYPDLDPINIDGTYKRMVYTQVKTMFYNNFRNPTQIWGLEKIDFDTSETKKFLSDLFKLFLIPTEIMGLKMVEGSVQIIDNTLDNSYLITDDGHNNLFAGTNLFSKQQELRDFTNQFQTGSDGICNSYFALTPPKNPYALTASQVGLTQVSYLNWLDAPADGFIIQRSINDSGSSFSQFSSTVAGVTSSFDTTVLYGNTYWYRVYAYNSWGTSSYTNTASVTIISSSIIPFQLDNSLPNICMGSPYSNSLSASYGLLPYTYSIISGSLPLGFTFNTHSGLISGSSSIFYPPITTSFKAAATDSLFRTATSSINLITTYCGIWEPWEDYITGSDVNGLNKGIGFSSSWVIVNDNTWQPQIISSEDFQSYLTGSDLNGATGGLGFLSFYPPIASNVNFNNGTGLLGFSSSWIITNDTSWQPQIISSEDFQSYLTGSDLNNATGGSGFLSFYPPVSSNVNFNQGTGSNGFSSSWIISNDTTWQPQILSLENFDLYVSGSDLNGLTGGLGPVGFYPPASSNVNFNNGTGSNGFSSSWIYINTT